MTAIVVDASFAAAVLIAPQRTAAALSLAAGWSAYDAGAPYVFALEMPWLLLKYERRVGAPGFTLAALNRLAALRIGIEDAPDERDRRRALALALELHMGLYDAMYVLAAQRRGSTLVTRDAGMIHAAGRAGVSILDVR